MPRKDREHRVFAAPDPTADSDVASIFKRVAAANGGWPRATYYDECKHATMLLRKVPGSFLSEMVPKGCPTNYPPSMAAFELAEKLITNGHAYRWLAFGYGRDWHAVGNSPDSALAGLRCRYQWQLAHLRVIQITPRFLASEQAQAYFRWKESSKTEPPIGYAENYMFLKLKRLWDYTPD